jgi:hypothetical protein
MKRKYARRRYLEMTDLVKHAKVLKANECGKGKKHTQSS